MAAKKCPSCKAALANVVVKDIEIKNMHGDSWQGASYVCQYCEAILSVGIDPLALERSLVQGIKDALRGN